MTFSSFKRKVSYGVFFLVLIILPYWVPPVMVYKCVHYQFIASRLKVNPSMSVLQKNGAGPFKHFFPLWTLPTEGAEET